MATAKQIVKAGNEFEEAQRYLSDLKGRKQVLQDALAEVNTRIDEAQVVTDAALASLKTLVNEP
jgi:hypothetical protein